MDSSSFSTSSTTPIMPMEAQASPSPRMPIAVDRNAGQEPHPVEYGRYPAQAESSSFINSWDASYVDAYAMSPPMASMDSIPYHDISGSPFVYTQYRYEGTGFVSPQTEGPTAGPAPTTPTTSATRNFTSATPRQRTFQACDKCRDRKTKCSGTKPVCERCAARGLICHYTKAKDSIRSARRTPSNSRMRSASYSSVEGGPDLQRYNRPKAGARLSFPYGSSPHALKADMPSTLAGVPPPVGAGNYPAHAFDTATSGDFFRPPGNASFYRPQCSTADPSAPSLNFPSPCLTYRDAADATSLPTLRSSGSGASAPAHALECEMWSPSPSLAHRPAAEQNMLALFTDDHTLPRRDGEHVGYGMPASAPHPEFASPSPFYEQMGGVRHCTP